MLYKHPSSAAYYINSFHYQQYPQICKQQITSVFISLENMVKERHSILSFTTLNFLIPEFQLLVLVAPKKMSKEPWSRPLQCFKQHKIIFTSFHFFLYSIWICCYQSQYPDNKIIQEERSTL